MTSSDVAAEGVVAFRGIVAVGRGVSLGRTLDVGDRGELLRRKASARVGLDEGEMRRARLDGGGLSSFLRASGAGAIASPRHAARR